jgi:transposase-like protein
MQRKVFGAELKAKVALEALAGRKTVNEIAGAYEVHPHQVATWKREAQEGVHLELAKNTTILFNLLNNKLLNSRIP